MQVNNNNPNQFLIYSPVAQARQGGYIVPASQVQEKKELNPEKLNVNLKAMNDFYTGKGEFTPLETTSPRTTCAKENEVLMAELNKNDKALQAYQKLSPPDKELFQSLTSNKSYGAYIKEKVTGELSGNPNKNIQKMFSEASMEDRDKITSQLGKLYFNRAVDMTEEGSPPKIYPEFMVKLLEQGKLGNKDSQGNSLLQNLHTMQNQQFAAGLDGKEVFQSTCRNITNPDFIHQGNRGTCSVTTVEYIQAKNHPAEFTRIASGLTGEQGEVTMKNGDSIKRPEGLLKDDGSLRTSVDRLYQASMMQYAKGDKNISYDNEKNRFTAKVLGSFRINAGEGINDKQLNKVLNAVLPYESVQIDYKGNIKKAEEELSGALSWGKPVPVCLKWDGKEGKHEVALEKMDEEFVYVRNPHGNLDDGKEKDGRAIKREALHDNDPELSGGHVKISKDEFYKKLVDYAIPMEKNLR